VEQSSALRRALGGIARGTIEKVNDQPKRQEHDINLHSDETKMQVEYFGHYGFHSVPVAPSGGQYAESIVAFLGGNRSHAVVIAVGDKRYEPTGWKEGEAGLHHYKGGSAKFTDAGWVHAAGDGKLPHIVTVGNLTVTWADGKATIDVGGTSVTITASRVDLGGLGGSAVETVAGPSSKVFAAL
jgi:phage baseplate assembly protein V